MATIIDIAWQIADQLANSRDGAGYLFEVTLTSGEVMEDVPIQQGMDGPVSLDRDSHALVLQAGEWNYTVIPLAQIASIRVNEC